MSAAAVVVGAALAGSPSECHATPFQSRSQDENPTIPEELKASVSRVSWVLSPIFWLHFGSAECGVLRRTSPRPVLSMRCRRLP